MGAMAEHVVGRSCFNTAVSSSSCAASPSPSPSSLCLPQQCDRLTSSSRNSCARTLPQLLLRTSAPEVNLVRRREGAAAPVARVTCVFGGDKRDAARKALESALGGKKEAFSKWDEEIKKREAGGGGGGRGRGRGWGGGGDGEGDSSSGEDGARNPSEALQVVYAFAGLASVYLILTKGGSILALVLNSILYVSRGFKPRATPRYAPASSGGSEDAESHVRSKWGSDD